MLRELLPLFRSTFSYATPTPPPFFSMKHVNECVPSAISWEPRTPPQPGGLLRVTVVSLLDSTMSRPQRDLSHVAFLGIPPTLAASNSGLSMPLSSASAASRSPPRIAEASLSHGGGGAAAAGAAAAGAGARRATMGWAAEGGPLLRRVEDVQPMKDTV